MKEGRTFPPLNFEGMIRFGLRGSPNLIMTARSAVVGNLGGLGPLHQPAVGPPPLQMQGRG